MRLSFQTAVAATLAGLAALPGVSAAAVSPSPSASANSTSSYGGSGSGIIGVPANYPHSPSDISGGVTLKYLARLALRNSQKNFAGGCTAKNVQTRQEFRTLPIQKRRDYVKAIKCMMNKPTILAKGVAPGAYSLFEDYVYVHMNQTNYIHLSGTFLTWHRYFIHVYEQEIRACGYDGNLPYWEWGNDVNDIEGSPLFDGSDASLGANGDYVPHEGLILAQPGTGYGLVYLAPGTGGGCITKGPFAGMRAHLGPVQLGVYGEDNSTGQADPYQDNDRCAKRDLSQGVAQQWTTFYNSTELLLSTSDIAHFQGVLQGDPRYVAGGLGVHGGGHFIMGGDPGGDMYISPNDPAFFVHHAQVDRLYWIWQNLDFANRQGVAGTHTIFNTPPSSDVTVDDVIDVNPVSTTTVPIHSLMNTVGNTPLCYQYV